VASGDLLPDLVPRYGAAEMVPKSLPPDACFSGHTDLDANCGGRPPGWPLVISPDLAGVLSARLISAALVAALFGWATVVAISLRRRGALAGLVVALFLWYYRRVTAGPFSAPAADGDSPSSGLATPELVGARITSPSRGDEAIA
jgi:hypothetical protein